MLTKNQLREINRITGMTPIGVNEGTTTLYTLQHRGHWVWIESTNKRIRKDLNFFLYVDMLDGGVAYRFISEVLNDLKTLQHA